MPSPSLSNSERAGIFYSKRDGYNFAMLSSQKWIIIYFSFTMQHLALDLETNNLPSFKTYPSAKEKSQDNCHAKNEKEEKKETTTSCLLSINAVIFQDSLLKTLPSLFLRHRWETFSALRTSSGSIAGDAFTHKKMQTPLPLLWTYLDFCSHVAFYKKAAA